MGGSRFQSIITLLDNEFELFLHEAEGYKPAPKDPAGFAVSAILGRGVRLTRRSRAAGLVFYTLDIQ